MLLDLGNPNQVTGTACFALAALASAAAARRGERAWIVLAGMNVAFCLEIVFGLRHRLHNVVDVALQQAGWYAGRTPWQVALLLAVAFAIVISAPSVWRAARGNGLAKTALLASFAVFASFAVEAVSLHDVDAWMYAPVGPLLAVVVGWAGAATIVTVAALVFVGRESRARLIAG